MYYIHVFCFPDCHGLAVLVRPMAVGISPFEAFCSLLNLFNIVTCLVKIYSLLDNY